MRVKLAHKPICIDPYSMGDLETEIEFLCDDGP